MLVPTGKSMDHIALGRPVGIASTAQLVRALTIGIVLALLFVCGLLGSGLGGNLGGV